MAAINNPIEIKVNVDEIKQDLLAYLQHIDSANSPRPV